MREVRAGRDRIRLGAWNVRGWGGQWSRCDPWLKKEALLEQADAQQWQAVLLSDLWFPENGIIQYRSAVQVWTLVHHGKVGVLLSEDWVARWRAGGARQFFVGQTNKKSSRAMALYVPGARRGRTGFYVVATCAPTADRPQAVESFWRE